MNLTIRQLARLRQHARQLHELELRQDARRAARTAQIEYLQRLKRQRERLPGNREAHLAAATTAAAVEALNVRFEAEEQRIAGEITAAQSELEGLQAAIAELSAVVDPHRELLERLLQAANVKPAQVGVAFGDDARKRPGELIASIGGR